MTTEQKILEVLNPVRLYTVEDWMKVAEILTGNEHSANFEALHLMERFEELTRGKWVEEHANYDHSDGCNPDLCPVKVWQPALLKKEHLKLFFEGFENFTGQRVGTAEIIVKDNLRIDFFQTRITGGIKKTETSFHFINSHSVELVNCTLFDFIYHLDKYNSTAKEPIKLFWKENFINQLIK